MKVALCCGVALFASFGTTVAQAQSADAPQTAGTAAAPRGTGIADIVVTAQRRSEPLQRVAVAVDVVGSKDLVNAQVTRATDLGALVPALQVSSAGGSTTSFYIRGVGAFTANSYSDSAVAFNYDGVYVSRPAASSGVFYDVARVEVLKGPQGTLYGRNATGGAINVLPERPVLGKLGGFVNASYGNYDALNVQGAVNIPVSATSAVRIAGMVVNRDGYLSDGTDDDKGWAIRPQFLFEPSDDLSIRIAGDFYKQTGKGAGASFTHTVAFNPATGSYSVSPSGLNPSIGVFDPRSAPVLASAFAGIAGRTLLPLPGKPRIDNETWGVNAELNWKTPIGTLTLVPAYRRFDEDVLNASSFTTYTRDRDEQFSFEGRLANDAASRLSWIVGGFYFNDKVTAPDFRVLMQVLDSFQSYKLKTSSYAGFGRLTFKVTDQFRLVGGGRYTHDRRSLNGTADVLLDVCTTGLCPGAPLLPFASSVASTVAQLSLVSITPNDSLFIQPGNPAAAGTIFPRGITRIDGSRKDGRFTYHLGAEWDVGDQSLLYLSYDTGFRSGGFAFSAFKPTFGPEKITALTLGSKNRFFDNRVQLNVEAFLWRYKDQQVSHLGPDPQLGSAFYTENIGKSVNKGIEVELQYQPVRDLRLFADVQYLHTNLKTFEFDVPATTNGAPNPPPLFGCAVTPPAAFTATSNYRVNCSGNPAFRSPEWTINMGVEQTVRLGDFELLGNLSTHYQSSNIIGFEFLPQQIQRGYWMSNAAVTLRPEKRSWSLSAFVNNIENKRRANLAYYNTPTSTITGSYSAPRTYGVRLGYEF